MKNKKSTINNQNPSTPALLPEDDDFRLSWRSSSTKEMVEEQGRGGRDISKDGGLVGEVDNLGLEGGEGEKLNLGAGVIIPFKLGDLDICFPDGS